MKISIIDYNAGNVKSVIYALNRMGLNPLLTNNPEEIKSADKVIFPGVGEASSTMRYLKNLELDKLIPQLQQPFLGICLGMQLMCLHSEENNTPCLGIIPLNVKKFIPPKQSAGTYKVPHMGWNNITNLGEGLFTGDLSDKYVYFVHSYYVEAGEYTTAQAEYIVPFSASVKKDNFYATQFHPEKSGKVGEQILRNFIEL